MFFQPHEDFLIEKISVKPPTTGDNDDEGVATVGDFMTPWSASQGEGNTESKVTKLSERHIEAARRDPHVVPSPELPASASL